LSAVSTIFNLFAVRRGVMVVGREAQSFRDDLEQLPGLILDFLCTPLRALGRMRRRFLVRGCGSR
jgi:hypothetical protein